MVQLDQSNKKIKVENKNSVFEIEPSNFLKIRCTIDFSEPIGKQSISLGNSYEDIYKQVIDSKTFCFFEDIHKKNERC